MNRFFTTLALTLGLACSQVCSTAEAQLGFYGRYNNRGATPYYNSNYRPYLRAGGYSGDGYGYFNNYNRGYNSYYNNSYSNYRGYTRYGRGYSPSRTIYGSFYGLDTF